MTPKTVDENVAVPPVGAVWVILRAMVVPGVIVAPVPVVAVWNWPSLTYVERFAFAVALVTPVNVMDSWLPALPKTIALGDENAPPLKLHVVL
jgi:hypothetical protein